MLNEDFDHGIPNNLYNKHAWIIGNPEIGDRVWIGAFCIIDAQRSPVKIGRGTDISSGTQILTHTTLTRCLSENRFPNVETAPVEIGDFCFIGTNAVILMGVKIGHHSVVAAGAVVPQGMVIPPYSVVAGIPAKIIGSSKKYLKKIENESISVVIPAYNEQETIGIVVKEAIGELKKITNDYEVVLVDDGSIDQTPRIIDSLVRKDKHIKAVYHNRNRGFTGAMKTSFKSASKHLILLAPADGQFDFKELKQFVDGIKGYDVAIGYRIENEEGFIRKFNSRLFHLFCRIFLDINFNEISTISMWRRRVSDSIKIESDDRSANFLPEIIHKAVKKRYRFTQVPFHWYQRKGGQAKGAKIKTIIKTFIGIFKLWVKIRLQNI